MFKSNSLWFKNEFPSAVRFYLMVKGSNLWATVTWKTKVNTRYLFDW